MSDTTISEAYSFTSTGAADDEQLLQSGRGGAGWGRSGSVSAALQPSPRTGPKIESYLQCDQLVLCLLDRQKLCTCQSLRRSVCLVLSGEQEDATRTTNTLAGANSGTPALGHSSTEASVPGADYDPAPNDSDKQIVEDCSGCQQLVQRCSALPTTAAHKQLWQT